jgi:hypothetical protein
MPRDLERRLRRLERAESGSRKFAIWYKQGDGTLLGPGGERVRTQHIGWFQPAFPR